MQNSFLFNMQRIGVAFIIFSVYAVFSASWASTGSLMPLIKVDLGLDNQKATLITSIVVVAKIFGASFTAFLIYKFGLKKGYFLGCLLMSSSVFLAFIESYLGILIVRFLMGLGSACALVCLVPITQQWFEKKSLHFMISINTNSNIVGYIIGILFAESISNYFGNWRYSLSFYAWINLVLIILWIFIGKDKKIDEKQEKIDNKKELLSAIKSPLTWGMIIFYMGPILFLNSIFTFLPTFYVEYAGFTKELAEVAKKEIPVLANVAIIFGPFIGIYFKRKGYSFKKMLLVGSLCMLLSGICMLFLKKWIMVEIFAVLSGLFFSLWWPFFFNLPSELKDTNPHRSAYIMSTFWTITFIILSLNLEIVSFSVDKTKSFTIGFTYMFILILVSAVASLFVFPKKDHFIEGGK
ncbi:MFS transporter [Campylobacter sp. 2018MI35]|uniref:MFS transporter n=1 Tax=Campylobacter molothri TaxID=1032242 RepID=UPI001903E2E1|nr:MFS transporter [Campylobacter sp. 2018MI35]MBK2001130.1 MFS transporter [Campylobacter sp. 2018MI35]